MGHANHGSEGQKLLQQKLFSYSLIFVLLKKLTYLQPIMKFEIWALFD
jgi:hypothetical protein